jgi:hypothetical protein
VFNYIISQLERLLAANSTVAAKNRYLIQGHLFILIPGWFYSLVTMAATSVNGFLLTFGTNPG